jgi:FkbM family methyltransferase
MRDTAPLWVSWSATAIRALPFGRYHAANALVRFAGEPFLARLPPDLGGGTFACDLHDTIAREVCFTGRYEPQETQLASRLLGPGMTVADVGANWGYFTLLCAHRVGATGRVLALEPHPRLVTLLAGNVGRNGLSQVEVLRVAAGAAAGSTPFVGFDERGGNWGVSRAARGNDLTDFEAPAATLDGLLDERRLDRVDLVKIDIEGAEVDALQGMTAGLMRGRYRYALVECHPLELKERGASVGDCVAPFARAGYRAWQIDHSPEMHRRAGAGPVPVSELLSAVEPGAASSERWPHFLFAAPGEAAPE